MTLLDTNVFVNYLKADPQITARLKRITHDELGIPAIVVYELEYGTLRSRFSAARRKQLEDGFGSIQHVPFDSAAAIMAARIRVELETSGTTIGALDLLIAGTAMSRGATLVTNNIKEFSRVPGLHVLDWKSV